MSQLANVPHDTSVFHTVVAPGLPDGFQYNPLLRCQGEHQEIAQINGPPKFSRLALKSWHLIYTWPTHAGTIKQIDNLFLNKLCYLKMINNTHPLLLVV